MPDFLLELLSEEIPARMQARAQDDLARLFREQLGEASLEAGEIETFATPRRLALIARGLAEETAAVREEQKGPRISAPPQALEGFLRKTGLTQDRLEERDGIWFALIERPGRRTADLLAEAIPAILRAFPWPKSMRWGEASSSTESPRWVRPLQRIVALLGEELVEFEVAGVKSGAATVGHRFHHQGIITIGSANDYAEKLRACHVIVDSGERRRIIRSAAGIAAEAAGIRLVEDEGLVAENAGLTEWPVSLLGRFDPAFLIVPPEVIQLTMRTNQKYFACLDGEGRLAPNFICTANIEAADGGAAIVAGNEKVLAARLSDAKFFWEQDLKIPLEEQATRLSQIVFHEKLGTVADKVERVARLARWLVEEGIVKPSPRRERGLGERESGADQNPLSPEAEREALAALAERAARLCKADLVTGMVGEFPELQGVIGGYLARAQGEPDEVADAIRDHYKPVGQGDDVPTAPVTVAVSLADKLDSLAQFFAIGQQPTGSRDPFALRRSALGTIALIVENRLRLRLSSARPELVEGRSPGAEDGAPTGSAPPDWWEDLIAFFADRLKVQQREAGVRHDIIDAVFALGGEDDLVRLLARVKALQAFVETLEGADLLAGYKRAANILKKEGRGVGAEGSTPPGRHPGPDPSHPGLDPRHPALDPRHPGLDPGSTLTSSTGAADGKSMPDQARHDEGGKAAAEAPLKKRLSYTPLAEETALIEALDAAEPEAGAAVEAEDFGAAMAALASLRGPVDSFFDKVTVNDPDPVKREARLTLLARMRDAVHRVADFSRIEG